MNQYVNDEFLSPKNDELIFDNHIAHDSSKGASNRRRLFNDNDRKYFLKKGDYQDDIEWSEKNISLSMSKSPLHISQRYQNPQELDNTYQSQNLDMNNIGQKLGLDKPNLTPINASYNNSFSQKQKCNLDIMQSKNIPRQSLQQSKNFIGNLNEQRQEQYVSYSPQKINDSKRKAVQKQFNIMLQIKKFQNKILKKSSRYVFRKSLNIGILYKFLNDKSFSLEDYKIQQNMKSKSNVNSHNTLIFEKKQIKIIIYFLLLSKHYQLKNNYLLLCIYNIEKFSFTD